MMGSRPKHLFVYGTLMRGCSRHSLLGGVARYVGDGTVHGRLYDFGEYPGAVRDAGAVVHGEVYELVQPEEALARLDEIEGFVPHDRKGSLFLREATAAELTDGAQIEVWVYFYNQGRTGAPLVRSGRYQAAK
jgi:gamma-glutamylcyclotransferase (GGCT)/AIG2-like uncharacterized protein YtfP